MSQGGTGNANGRDCHTTPPPCVLHKCILLKIFKVLCFDTLLQVLILKVLTVGPVLGEMRLQRTLAGREILLTARMLHPNNEVVNTKIG